MSCDSLLKLAFWYDWRWICNKALKVPPPWIFKLPAAIHEVHLCILILYHESVSRSAWCSFQMVDVSLPVQDFSSGPQASWGGFLPSAEFPPLRQNFCHAKPAQTDDSWMPSDRPCICSAVNYSARSIFTSLREVWKPLASALSAAPAVAHQQGLVSQRASFLTDPSRPREQVLPAWRKKGAPPAIQLVSLGARVTFYPKSDWSPGPSDNLPSHLPFIQTQASTHQAAAALSSVSPLAFIEGKLL